MKNCSVLLFNNLTPSLYVEVQCVQNNIVLKIVLLNWRNTAQEKWKKGTQAHFSKMVKMLYLALKTIT